MALIVEIIDANGVATRQRVIDGRLDVPVTPGSTYRILDESGRPIGPGPRVLRFGDDIAVEGLPEETTITLRGFFADCSPDSPCSLSLEELGGGPGAKVTPDSEPLAALAQGGFLMNRPGTLTEPLPTAPESEFNWKPIAAIGGGLAVLGGLAAGGGGGGDPDTTPPVAPTFASPITNSAFPTLSGTAEPGSTVTLSIDVGGSGNVVTYRTSTDGSGNWAIDTRGAPLSGALPPDGLPTSVPSTVNLVARDPAGNLSPIATGSIVIDTVPPTAIATVTSVTDNVAPVTGAIADGGFTNDPTPAVTGALSEPLAAGDRVQWFRYTVQPVPGGEPTLSQAPVAQGFATVDGTTFSVLEAALPAGGFAYRVHVVDAAGNASALSAPFRFTVDLDAPPLPTIAAVATDDLLSAAEAAAGVTLTGSAEPGSTVAITWTAASAGPGAAPLGSATADATGNWSLAVPLGSLPSDGPTQVRAIATDAAGNAGPQAVRGVTVDRLPPSVTITDSIQYSTVGDDTVTLTFQFSEPVSGFDIADIGLTGGTAGTLSTTDNTSFTLPVTVPQSTGTLAVSLLAGAALDGAGNPTQAANRSVALDRAPPALTISDNIPAATTNAGSVTFTLSFNEPVFDFDPALVTVTGGTRGTFTQLSPTSFSVPVTLPANAAGSASITVGAGTVVDAAGNPSPAGSASQAYDRLPPSVTSIVANPSGTANGPVIYTVTFSEPVTGFNDTSDVIVLLTGANASATNISGSGSTGTFRVTPPADATGTISVAIAANSVTDAAGNVNAASAQTPLQNFDTRVPGLTISDTFGGQVATGPVTYQFEFGQDVTGFELQDIVVNNGTASNLTGSGTTYSAIVTPTPNTTGTLSVSVPAGAATSSASGQGSTAASAAAQAYDVQAPTMTVTDDTPGIATGTVVFTFAASEALAANSFTSADIDVVFSVTSQQNTVGPLTPVSGTNNFTLSVTPAPESDGTIDITVAAGAFTDVPGNPNAQVITTSQAYDTRTPAPPPQASLQPAEASIDASAAVVTKPAIATLGWADVLNDDALFSTPFDTKSLPMVATASDEANPAGGYDHPIRYADDGESASPTAQAGAYPIPSVLPEPLA